MPKFFVYKTYIAEITDVMEVEAESEAEAIKNCNEGDYKFIGTDVLEYISGGPDIEVLPCREENLPQFILVPHGAN